MDISKILKSHTDESGNISADKLAEVAKDINTAVGNEFVAKKRYDDKLTEIDTLKEEKQNAEDKITSAEKWKTKYDALKQDFDDYKNDISAKATKEAKEKAFEKLLKDASVSEKYLSVVKKASKDEIEALELGEDGAIKDADKLTEAIKADWAEFITKTETKGDDTKTPPINNGGSTMTKDEIMAIKDAGERQKAIAENPEVFGI